MTDEKKAIFKLTFGEWVLLVGGILSVGASHARIGMNTDGIKNNSIAIQENKAFGIARDKKMSEDRSQNREYARDYSYRKDAEIIKDVDKLTDVVYSLSQSKTAITVEISHIKENQKKVLALLEKLIEQNNK